MTKPLAFKNVQQKISVKIKLFIISAPLKQNLKTLYHPNKSAKNAKILKFSPNDKKKKTILCYNAFNAFLLNV
ncbi:hypothetical protein HpBhutan357_04710 [Helicobacter pylori]